jgi:hypothetical protein
MTRAALALFVALAGPAWADDGVGRINVPPIPQNIPSRSCVPAPCAVGSDQFGCMSCSGVTMRTYTVDEIDRMRKVLILSLVGSLQRLTLSDGRCIYTDIPTGQGLWYPTGPDCEAIDRSVEDQLRTYIAADISPEELERKAERK